MPSSAPPLQATTHNTDALARAKAANSAGGASKPYSEQTGQLIDEEVKNLIDSMYVRTKELLDELQTLLNRMLAGLDQSPSAV